ncbi:MAG: hypothetical protein AB7V56_12615 [Candidatus Nitrosocosmicus sp.]
MQNTKVTPINNVVNGDYKPICNGFGCYETATEKIIESAGEFGLIKLDLCNRCVSKFGYNKNEEGICE